MPKIDAEFRMKRPKRKRLTLREKFEIDLANARNAMQGEFTKLEAELARVREVYEQEHAEVVKFRLEYQRLSATYNALQASERFDPTEKELLGYSAQAIANHLFRLYGVTGKGH